VRPIPRICNQFGTDWIVQDIRACDGESIATAFFFAEHMVVCLALESARRQRGFQISTQKRHPISLIGILT